MEEDYTEEEFRFIEIEDPQILFDEVSKYISDNSLLERVKDAYYYANKKHSGQMRKSGSPFIVHPLTCAYYLAQWKMNIDTIIAGLLHDVIEDTPVLKEEIELSFGKNIANMVDSLSKSNFLTKENSSFLKGQYLEKLIFGLVKDINVIFVKLADRMSNVLTLGSLKPEKQIRIAKETLDIYVSIANRLGMKKARENLEEICFKITDPVSYNLISEELSKSEQNREQMVKKISVEIAKSLDYSSILGTKVFGRYKSKYSIFSKMQRLNQKIINLGDVLAFRVITKTIDDCYLALSVVHKLYTPLPGRFKDYIATPKNNMYQSLHTIVISKDGFVFEVQIRTYKMNEIAESGVAAHWKYKRGEDDFSEKEKEEQRKEKTEYINNLLNISNQLNDLSDNFNNEIIDVNVKENINEIIKTDLLQPTVYVLQVDGSVFNFPIGSTVLDYSYKIDPAKANKTSGALINGIEKSFNYVLNNGDIVEILYSKDQRPDKLWLNYVRSNDAKKLITTYLEDKTNQVEEKLSDSQLIIRAAEQVNEYIINHNLKWDIDDRKIAENIRKLKFKNKDLFLLAIAKKDISIEDAINFVYLEDVDLKKISPIVKSLKISKFSLKNGRNDINIGNKIRIECQLARCCYPLPIDDIIALNDKSTDQLLIHRDICRNILSMAKTDLIENSYNASWIANNVPENFYITNIVIKVLINNKVINDVANIILNNNANIISINPRYESDIQIINILFELKGISNYNALVDKIKELPGYISSARYSSEDN
ncbi:RelA/SpoT family protein [Spiroplasma endosymbiont of Aspidapion aeneum]|uniref:RelA/SpoT family protein n=1 Tax=Spiroplasma endosymbiont of Aspidapion aeneum TaxID=3066276 RepID=UPI00313A7A3B